MKCDRCKEEAVAYLRYFNRKLCKDHFCKLTEERAKKTISRNKLFDRNDKVGVAVSGGKDSITLLHFLNKFAERFPIELYGVIVNEGIKGYRDASVKIAEKNFKELGIEYKVVSFKKRFGKALDSIVKSKNVHPCSHCGVFRRRLLNETAHELKVNKLAVGHNLDDEVQSIFMNYMRGDFARMLRMGAKTTAKKGFIPRVKPFREIPEKEIGLYAILQNYKVHLAECPYVPESLREDVRNQINYLEQEHPGTKFQILKGADNLVGILGKHYKSAKLYNCTECGEPSPTQICKVCQMVEEI